MTVPPNIVEEINGKLTAFYHRCKPGDTTQHTVETVVDENYAMLLETMGNWLFLVAIRDHQIECIRLNTDGRGLRIDR